MIETPSRSETLRHGDTHLAQVDEVVSALVARAVQLAPEFDGDRADMVVSLACHLRAHVSPDQLAVIVAAAVTRLVRCEKEQA